MARATSSTAIKFAWPLVILGGGFVICLVLAIVFYTQRSDAQQQNDDLEQELGRFVTDQQESSPAVQQLLTESEEGGNTVVGLLLERADQMRSIIGVGSDASVEDMEAQLEEQGIDSSLLQAVSSLDARIASLESERGQLQSQLESARGRIESLQQQQEKWSQQLAQARQQLESRYQTQQQQADQVQQRLASMEDSLTQQVQQTRQQLQQRIDQLQQQKSQLENENEELQQRIDTLLAKPGMEAVGKDIAIPDGRITGVLENQKKAYINLGRADHLRLGMTFEVFSEDTLVEVESEQLGARARQTDEQEEETVIAVGRQAAMIGGEQEDDQQDREEIRGKATVEVINIDEGRALVRVMRQARGTTLKSGDVPVNVPYSARQPVVFHVHGQFDLDGDGQADDGDRERLKSIIRGWGGRIADELTYQVDFLVLGQPPSVPEQGGGQPANQQAAQEQQAAREAYETYQTLLSDARELSIPVMNQTRFLALVGYYKNR